MIYLKEGNIPLNNAYNDEIKQEANGTYQLMFHLPTETNEGIWKQMAQETLLVADDLAGKQEFVIIETERKLGHLVVYANQVATLLNTYGIDKLSVDRATGATVMSRLSGSLLRESPFTFFSDMVESDNLHTLNLADCSVMDALSKGKHSIIGQWGGDLVRDRYNIRLLNSAGRHTEALFMYKKNIKDYQRTSDYKNLMTKIHFVKKIQTDNREITLKITVDSPLIGSYKNVYEGFVEVNEESITDEDSLRKYGEKYFQKTRCDMIHQTIKVDVSGIDTDVQLFDYVGIRYDGLEDMWGQKITYYDYSPMQKKLKTIGFGEGNATSSLGKTIDSIASTQVDERLSDIDATVKKELDNANRAFDAEFEKQKTFINDAIEQSKAKAAEQAAELEKEINEKIESSKNELTEKTYQEFLKKLDEPNNPLIDKLTKSSEIDELRHRIDEASEKTRINAEAIGGDGGTQYNRNRLDGATERLIPLGENQLTSISHNGDGFEIGTPYTISWKAVCVPRGHGDLTLQLRAQNFRSDGMMIHVNPRNSILPRFDEPVTSKNIHIQMVYYDTYDVTVESDWYKTINTVVTVDEGARIPFLRLQYKDTVDGNDAKLTTIWNENPDIIFDGGGN